VLGCAPLTEQCPLTAIRVDLNDAGPPNPACSKQGSPLQRAALSACLKQLSVTRIPLPALNHVRFIVGFIMLALNITFACMHVCMCADTDHRPVLNGSARELSWHPGGCGSARCNPASGFLFSNHLAQSVTKYMHVMFGIHTHRNTHALACFSRTAHPLIRMPCVLHAALDALRRDGQHVV